MAYTFQFLSDFKDPIKFKKIKAHYAYHSLTITSDACLSPLTIPSTVQSDEISDEVSGLQVPELHRAVVAAGHHKVVGELEAGYRTLVLVGALQRVQAVARGDVPHLQREIRM